MSIAANENNQHIIGRTQFAALVADVALIVTLVNSLKTQLNAVIVDVAAHKVQVDAAVADLAAIRTSFNTAMTKLNADAGVTDTNYAAASALTSAATGAATGVAVTATNASATAKGYAMAGD